MRKLACALLVLLLTPLAGASGGHAWKKKPLSQWSEEETLEFLTDSPWARLVEVWQVTEQTNRRVVAPRQQVYQDAPGEPATTVRNDTVSLEPVVVEARYLVQWSSATIVEQAWERLRQVAAQAVVDLHAPPPELSPVYAVLTVRVTVPPSPSAQALFAGLSDEELRARARLHTSGKLTLAPERVVRHGLGAAKGVSFFFPRVQNGQATLPPGTEGAEFIFEGAKGDKLKARFKLREMQVNGQPDY